MLKGIYGTIISSPLDLHKIDVRNIDTKLENRTKRIIRLETLLRDSGKGETELKAEIAKLKADNRSLKVCLCKEVTDKQSEYNELLSKSRTKGLREKDTRDTPSPGPRTVAISAAATTTNTNASPSQGSSTPGTDKRWLLRFQELETRLKAEQEGRALDQKGAKLRLDEVRKENAELKSEIIKEKDGMSVGSMTTSVKSSKENLKGREAGNGSA